MGWGAWLNPCFFANGGTAGTLSTSAKLTQRAARPSEMKPALDGAAHAAYNADHGADIRDHHSNYVPGALTYSSRRDNGVGPARAAPHPKDRNDQ